MIILQNMFEKKFGLLHYQTDPYRSTKVYRGCKTFNSECIIIYKFLSVGFADNGLLHYQSVLLILKRDQGFFFKTKI